MSQPLTRPPAELSPASDFLAATGVPTNGLRVLHVEDTVTVRETVRVFLQPMGFVIEEAETASEALHRMTTRQYDIVICDYLLGDGPDGQSLLDKVRREGLIPRSTTFIMLTTERAYARVAQVVELAPDTYLLKPFTLHELEKRVRVQLGRVATLRPALDALDAGNFAEALERSQAVIARREGFTREAQRISYDSLVGLGRLTEAQGALERFIASSEVPVRWALYERARIARMIDGESADGRSVARELLKAVQQAFPHYVPPVDDLCEMALEDDDLVSAHLWATKAAGVSGTPERFRRLGFVEKALGNMAAAENAFAQAIERGKSSFYGDAVDFALCADAAMATGGRDRAVRLVADGRNSLAQSAAARVLLPLVSAEANNLADRTPGERKAAAKEMPSYLAEEPMDPRVAIVTAELLVKNQMFAQAAGLLQKLQERARLDRQLELRVAGLLDQTRKGEEATAAAAAAAEAAAAAAAAAAPAIGTAPPGAPAGAPGQAPVVTAAESERAIIKNNEAVHLLRAGSIDEAVQLLEDALAEIPAHETLRSNLVKALLRRAARDDDPAPVERAATLVEDGRAMGIREDALAPLATAIAAVRKPTAAAAATVAAAPAPAPSRFGRLFGRK